MAPPGHQFTHANIERRASVVYGSVGKQGLYLPSDFLDSKRDDEQPLLGRRRSSTVQQEIINEERAVLKAHRIPVDLNNVEETFEEAVVGDKLSPEPLTELVALVRSSVPLVATFLLQNSLSTVSVFSVGHLGAVELAAVSMGAMTANITGYATIQGIATALDTLCPQAFGAEKYTLVGDFVVKCTALICVVMVPVLISWVFFGYQLIALMIPDLETAQLAAVYLRYISPGIPAYIVFECGKRFLQAQGVYHVSTYVLLVAAPLNLVMNLLFVRAFGYVGAPIAVSINYWIMAAGLVVSIFYVDKRSTPSNMAPLACWSGFSVKKALEGWGALVGLAIPGLVMLEAEFLAFEILTLMASYLGTLELAAQSIATCMALLTYQVPFAVGIALLTRIANYLGAGLADCARLTTRVALLFGLVVLLLNFAFLFLFQTQIARAFTNDERVVALLRLVMWLVATMQVLDAMNANSAGCLRGQGQTKIGGIVNLFLYYVVGIPLSIYLAFYSPIKGALLGLWVGSTVALTIIGGVQSYYALCADFGKLCADARRRTEPV